MTAAILMALGGLMALDGTSLGQFMISRPLVAGALGGLATGDPLAGLLAGAILELIHLNILPVGGVGYPETGPASVVAGAAAGAMPTPGGLAIAVGIGIVWAGLGGASVHLQRRINGHLVPHPESGPVDAARLQQIHLRLLILDFFRGVVLVSTGLLVSRVGLGLFSASWPLSLAHTIAFLTIGAAVPLGALVRRQGKRAPTRLLFVGGVAVGLILAAIL